MWRHGLMVNVLKFWLNWKSDSIIDAYLCEEHSCQISSRFNLKRWSLRFLKRSPLQCVLHVRLYSQNSETILRGLSTAASWQTRGVMLSAKCGVAWLDNLTKTRRQSMPVWTWSQHVSGQEASAIEYWRRTGVIMVPSSTSMRSRRHWHMINTRLVCMCVCRVELHKLDVHYKCTIINLQWSLLC